MSNQSQSFRESTGFRFVMILEEGIPYKAEFKDLKEGDIFQIFEEDGFPVGGIENTNRWYLCVSDVYFRPSKAGTGMIATVETDPAGRFGSFFRTRMKK